MGTPNFPPFDAVSSSWEQRFEEWSENDVWVGITLDNQGKLSKEEFARVAPLIEMVKLAANKLALNMVKGVIKYNNDGRLIEEWLEFAIDDASDTLNYLYLMKGCITADKSEGG